MKKNNVYTNAPAAIAKEINESVAIDDFLPSPKRLAAELKKELTVPVTMKLKKSTLMRYKTFAQKTGIKYQSFVSSLLDKYAERL